MNPNIIELFNLFFLGLLAGIEFLVRFSIRSSLNVLDEKPRIQLRQELIYKMRFLVSTIFMLSTISAIIVVLLNESRSIFHYAGIIAIIVWAITTFTGTVPLNSAIITWNLNNPPKDWKDQIKKWEKLDTIRTFAALAAFALFLVAAINL